MKSAEKISSDGNNQEPDVEKMVCGIMNGNRQMLARAITLVESQNPKHEKKAHEILDRCLEKKTSSIRIGITGSPGVGKSTFIEALGLEIINSGHRLAVLAIDPSSMQSKGSILGDKARMEKLATKKEAYIRPSASSGYLGGTSPKTHETILLCEAAGYDVIIVETVGVGQSEILVDSMTDFTLLLMLPGSGDELQGIKRGIMEIADAIAVTKTDGEQSVLAAISKAECDAALRMLPSKYPFWKREVFLTSAITATGIREVWQNINEFFAVMQKKELLRKKREQQLKNLFSAIVEDMLKKKFYLDQEVGSSLPITEQLVVTGKISPFSGASSLINIFRHPDTLR
ncbi:methylmalonyl Co-A mutase-associated GTPase MeaB [Chlorobium phaeobacteroides]|uniref:LAO/AO transport system ATPase n=1 Tax=Chlorobium phaeobacteroides (strain DSM 266 / SMG 266 / 2430) TaxID=290317 RepID=A1BFM3_CHLPD|nr:methylmalonyl Co-A mutase-associated GTPase MeaB [Chlorobium phaeobacteroides]ABL65200.1 LAO/AO transport system ATPase [Chlorobium phaeobacteroides DSM 266]